MAMEYSKGASFMSSILGTKLLSTPGQFGPALLP